MVTKRSLLLVALCSLALEACSRESGGGGPKRQRESNPASVGFIDFPKEGAIVDSPVAVSGWALDESGVRLVRIYFDDELMVSAAPASVRRDVEQRYPERRTQDGVHGFDAVINAGSHSGYTLIRAEVIDEKGGLTSVYSVTVKIKE